MSFCFQRHRVFGHYDVLGRGVAARLAEGRGDSRILKQTLAQRLSIGWDVQGECPQAGQIELRQRRTTLNQSHLALSIGRVEAQLNGVAIGFPAVQGDFEIGVARHGGAQIRMGSPILLT